VSFLKFLVSGETDIDVFSKGQGERVLPVIELYPEGMESSRPSRKRLGVQAAGSCSPRNPMECEPAWL
jgi:hypothetical protein